MKIGCVKEIKKHEYRVGMTPNDVRAYIKHGHSVMLEKNAGVNAGYVNEEYAEAGAEIVDDKHEVYDKSEMIIKVKEPLAEEYDLLHKDQLLYTYLHLAASEDCTKALLKNHVKAVAYETIEEVGGHLPCLQPMSEIAGRLSIQEGAKFLEKTFGGRGVLLGGVPGVRRGKIVILGGGVVGTNAAKMATGIGADVTLLDINAKRLAYLDDIFGSRITTLYSTEANIDEVLQESDVVIGAVLLHGGKAPHLIRKDHLKKMKAGAVIVDVAVDQGGCAETTKPTTHDDPVYVIDDIVHYCVANMPGVVALSSTNALTSATLPYGLMIADNGLEQAIKISTALELGVNTYGGECTYENVAHAFGMDYVPLNKLI